MFQTPREWVPAPCAPTELRRNQGLDLAKGDNVPNILLLTKYPYGLSSFLWPYQDVHTFPMRYVTELACEHSCPLPSNLNSVHQATGQPRYPHKFPQATGNSLSAQEFTSNWIYNIRTSSLEQLDTRYPHKSSQATGYNIRTSSLEQLDNRYPHKSSQATGHCRYPHKASQLQIQEQRVTQDLRIDPGSLVDLAYAQWNQFPLVCS